MAETEAGRARRGVTIVGGAIGLAQRLSAALDERTQSWFWLDGAAAAPGEPPVSYLGIAAELAVPVAGRPHEFLERISGAAGPAAGDAAGFCAGWVAALGYEFGEALLGLDPTPDSAPAALALRADVVIAVAGERGELRAGAQASIDEWLTRYGALLSEGAPGDEPRMAARSTHATRAADARASGAPQTGRWRHDDPSYEAEVEACKSAIREGEAYVLCLTDTLSLATRARPLDVFLRLRERAGALRGGLIVTPGRALVSASPERFLSVRGARVATHPIKGTRPRGDSPAADEQLAAELQRDPKERAENLMIVDLMRNDLSRVCAPESVAVSGFLRVEQHPHVHQLVSTVSGTLRPGQQTSQVIAACFPGGSMTGAPKRRAVEILRGLEAGPRGLYAGCFGWLDADGDAELAMTIRGVEFRGTGALREARIGAGGGITADSRAATELAEKHLKAAALLSALDTVNE